MTGDSVPSVGESAKTSPSLLKRVKKRDPEAWKRFVDLYGPLVYFWCRKAGLQEANAADVGQDVFVAVSRSIENYEYDPKGPKFRGWLRVVTRSKIAEAKRRLPPGAEGEGGSDALERLEKNIAADAEDENDLEDRQLLLHQAVEAYLADSKPHKREAFLRIVIGREDPSTVADSLGISVNAIYLHKSRILHRIREDYADLLDLD